jgi:hypothetical protein
MTDGAGGLALCCIACGAGAPGGGGGIGGCATLGGAAGIVVEGSGPLVTLSLARGFPTRGCGRAEGEAGAEAGSDSFGRRRDSVNIALAERGFPTFGFRIARS